MGGSILNRVIDIFGLGDEDEEVYEDLDASSQEDTHINNRYKNSGRVLSIQGFRRYKVVVMQPIEYGDMIKVCSCLKDGHIVIMDLKKMELSIAQRCMDFASGVISAIDGSMAEVTRGIFVVTPDNSQISCDISDGIQGNERFSWVK